jgi:hypothetical protein
MVNERLLICSVNEVGGALVCACTHCGWVSAPTSSATEGGALWDDHMARAHRPVAATAGA